MAAFVRVSVCECLCVCVSWLCLNPVGSQTSSNGHLSEFWGREPECLSCDLMEQRAGGWAATGRAQAWLDQAAVWRV